MSHRWLPVSEHEIDASAVAQTVDLRVPTRRASTCHCCPRRATVRP